MRLGIIGTGRIARRFVPECEAADDIEIAAVYNPHEGSAKKYVSEVWKDRNDASISGGPVQDVGRVNSCPAALSDLNALWDKVDAVYIASLHETHYNYIMDALEHDKHVLCEKPIVLHSKEAQEAFLIANERKLVLMEAIKTVYCPGYQKLMKAASSGIIGEVKYIESCFTKLEDPGSRELTDTKYGGSFTELGSYVCLPVLDLLGSGYTDIRFSRINNGIGLDIFTKAEFTYGNGFASAICGLGVKAEGSLLIAGTEGYIKVDAPWWKTRRFEVHFEDSTKVFSYDEEFEGDGLRYEIEEFICRVGMKSGDDKYNNRDRMRSICLADLMERFRN